MGGRFSFTYGASRLQDNCLAVKVRKGRSRASSKVRGFSWEMPGGGRRRGMGGRGEEEGGRRGVGERGKEGKVERRKGRRGRRGEKEEEERGGWRGEKTRLSLVP